MKNKYQRMSKEEKKKLQESYKKTELGANMLSRLKRIVITGSLGAIVSIVLIILAIIEKGNIFDYIYAGVLTVASIVFLIGSFKIKNKVLNDFALEQKNK